MIGHSVGEKKWACLLSFISLSRCNSSFSSKQMLMLIRKLPPHCFCPVTCEVKMNLVWIDMYERTCDITEINKWKSKPHYRPVMSTDSLIGGFRCSETVISCIIYILSPSGSSSICGLLELRLAQTLLRRWKFPHEWTEALKVMEYGANPIRMASFM